MKLKMKKSSGNVYRDIGFSVQKAENLRIRGVLMMEIERYIKRRGLSQAAAAKYFGVKQPEISHLVNGHIDRFGIDKLINMASQIGKEINIKINPAKTASSTRPSKRARKARPARAAAAT